MLGCRPRLRSGCPVVAGAWNAKGTAWCRPMCGVIGCVPVMPRGSILVRKQQAGRSSMAVVADRLGDAPELGAVRQDERSEDAAPILQGAQVQFDIIGVETRPYASQVPFEKLVRRL